MKTDFLPSGNHFFSIFSDSSQLLPVEAVFSSTRTYFSANALFRLLKTSFLSTWNAVFLFHFFFLLIKNITEISEKTNLKMNRIPASANELSAYGNSVFLLVRAIFYLLLEIISVIKRYY